MIQIQTCVRRWLARNRFLKICTAANGIQVNYRSFFIFIFCLFGIFDMLSAFMPGCPVLFKTNRVSSIWSFEQFFTIQ